MRSLVCITTVLVVTANLPGQGEPVDKRTLPLKVVNLNRTTPVIYEKEIEPILVNKCIFCHSGNIKEAKLDLSSHEGLMKGGKRGKDVIPGKGDESILYKMCAKTMKPLMPPKSEEPLTPEELALIKLWIDQGAKPPTGASLATRIVVSLPPDLVKPVRGVAISPDKSTVAASRGNTIHVYSAEMGEHVRSLIDPNLTTEDKKPVQASHISLVESLEFSPDGKVLASGSFREVTLWDPQTGAVKQRLTGFAHMVVALAFSKDGKLLAIGGGAPTDNGELKVFEVETGKLVVDIKEGHSDTVYGVSFSPDGKMLAACAADKFVKTFEIPSGKFVKAFEGHTHHVLDVSWRGDGKVLASAGADNAVKIWDFEKGEQLRSINAHNKQVTRLEFIGTTNTFITCSADTLVRKWNSDNGGNQGNYSGNADYLYAVSVSPDGNLVATGGEEGIVRLYKAAGAPFKNLLPPEAEVKKEDDKK